MTSYGDPELLIGQWLTDQGFVVRSDPDLRADWWADAPIVHLQRGQGFGGLALSLDDVLCDISVYGASASHVREVSGAVNDAMVFELPKVTFPNGLFVTMSGIVSPFCWAPDPTAYRRAASYRAVLHGVITAP